MKIDRLGIKLFLDQPDLTDIREVIPLFHSWIQKQAITDHLLLDVHDYSHVPDGPGILLYGHEGSFSLALRQGRLHLIYRQHRPSDGSHEQKLSHTLRPLLQGCLLLESYSPAGAALRFGLTESEFTVYDRLHAPNTDETLQAFEPVLSSFLRERWGVSSFHIEHLADPRRLFAVKLSVEPSPTVAELLERLENDRIN